MMRSAILLGSAAMVGVLATPAFALPDRYEQGYGCAGATTCTQQLRQEDGNRFDEKGGNRPTAGDNRNVTGQGFGQGGFGQPAPAARTGGDDDGDDNEIGDDVENAADETGDAIDNAADETGDEVGEVANEGGDVADEAGDAIGGAADEAGDAIDDAF